MVRLTQKTPDEPPAVLVLAVPTIVGLISVVNYPDPAPGGTRQLSFVYPFCRKAVRPIWRRAEHVMLAVLVLLLTVIALAYQFS